MTKTMAGGVSVSGETEAARERMGDEMRAPVRRRERETANIVWGMVDLEPAKLSPLVTARPRPAPKTVQRRTRTTPRVTAGARLALPRYLATWTDGVTRVIHAQTHAAASELAARLEVADDVFVVSVKALP